MRWFVKRLFLFLICAPVASGQTLKAKRICISYDYLVHVPQQQPSSGFPLLLFLHGADERGTDINLVARHNPAHLYPDTSNFPFLLIAPQCPAGLEWNAETLIMLLDEIEKTYPVNTEKEYITGISMGGFGTWNVIKKAPGRFAAAVPVCGGGDTSDLCLLRYTPVWAFHGEEDATVPVESSRRMIEALNHAGGQGKLTVYPKTNHNSWDSAYASTELYEWLLRQERLGEALPVTDMPAYAGTYIYTGPQSEDTLHTYVTLEQQTLWYEVPRYNFKAKLYRVADDLFRLEGIPLSGDSELYFVRDKQGKIIGHSYYPCDRTFVPKVK